MFSLCFNNSLDTCFGNSRVPRLLLMLMMVMQVELPTRCVVTHVKATMNDPSPIKVNIGEHFTHSRREENVGMCSKLPVTEESRN